MDFYRFRKISTFIAVMLAATLLSSCVKDELHNTPHPDRGAVTVSLTGLAADGAYVLDIDGQTADITGSSFTFPDLLTPGTHSLVVYNRAEGFTFDGRMAQVHTEDGKTRADGASIIPLPGYLKTASREITVTADDTLHLTPAPQQRVRDLHIEFTVTQGRPELIQTVTGTLSGIATRDGDKLTADARLLGTMGAVQTLVLDIVFVDGGRTQRTEVDLTEALADFNGNMTDGYRVTGTLETPVGMEEASAEITGWETVDGSGVDAEM